MTPTDGVKDSSNTTCGSTVQFNCNECYELEGHDQLSCLSNKTWSGEEPNCTGKCTVSFVQISMFRCFVAILVKSCPVLNAPIHGKKKSSHNTCGSTVEFLCNKCYELEGNKNLTCLPDETWSGEEPNCTC